MSATRLFSSSPSASPSPRVTRPTQHLVQRDTAGWRWQVWISFALAVLLAGSGLGVLSGTDIERAFMAMGYVFSVSSAFALAKAVRDREIRPDADSPLWKLVVGAGFAAAMALTAWGLTRLAIHPVWKAYLAVSWLFLISSVFTLAKTLRDAHEADRLEASLTAQRAEVETDDDDDRTAR